MMKKLLLVLMLLTVSILLVACVKSIADIKSEEYLDKKVTVRGEVSNTIKLGDLSGYTITDDDGNSVGIASEDLPKEGVQKTVTGVVKKSLLLGYYIQT